MTKTVYLVTSGEYSDYRINAAFTTVTVATAYADRRRDSYTEGRDVETYVLHDALPEAIDVLHFTFGTNHGTTSEWHVLVTPGFGEYAERDVTTACHWTALVHGYGHNGPYAELHVIGCDHERVRKVFSEKRAWIVAEQDVLFARARAADNYLRLEGGE